MHLCSFGNRCTINFTVMMMMIFLVANRCQSVQLKLCYELATRAVTVVSEFMMLSVKSVSHVVEKEHETKPVCMYRRR